MKPQNKGDIVTLLGQVRKALTVKTYRNNYEDKNAFESNIERLAVCEVHLGDSCTGVITDSEERQRLMTEVVELRKALCEKHYPNGVGVVFVKDLHGAKGQCIMEECRFLKEMEAHADNEVEEDEEMLPRGKNKNFENKKKDKNNKKKKKSNIENDINNKLVDKVQHNSNETTVEKACNPNTNPLSNIDGCKYSTKVRDGKNETPALRSPCTNINDILSTSNVFATYHNCLFSDLDRSALLSSCTATPVKNSPLIELTYDTLVPFSNKEIPAKYCLSMYRVVAAALWRGPPKEHVGEQKQSTSISTSDIYNPYLSHEAVGNVEINDDEAFLFLEEDDGDDEEESIRKALEKNSTDVTSASQISDFDVIRDVTEALAQQYVEDAWLQELQQETRGTPSVISNSTVHFLEATAAPWVVLMCHGGYFCWGSLY